VRNRLTPGGGESDSAWSPRYANASSFEVHEDVVSCFPRSPPFAPARFGVGG
jgi:hypothetical protein